VSVGKRCGCRDADGRQWGKDCPKLSARNHGSYFYRFSAGTDPKTGKRRQIGKDGFDTRKAALDAEAKERAKVAAGTYTKPSNMILADYAVEWLQRRQATGRGLKATTAANYERYVRADIVPSMLGAMKLSEIRRHDINRFAADLTQAGRGATTVRRILTRLGTIFASAVKDELIGANPVVGADRPVLPDAPVRVWEPASVREFLQRSARHRLGPVFELAVLSGLRRGELCGLCWSDVDLVARKIVVRRNRVTIDGKIQEQSTKTRAGLRTIPLSDVAVASLLAWQLRQAAEAEAAGEAWHGAGYVFTNEVGRPLDPALITRLFQVIRRGDGQDAELPPLSFHGLRHCAASLMLASGADIAVVSKLMGHASISVTSDVYGHLVGTIAQKAVDGAANLIAHTSDGGCLMRVSFSAARGPPTRGNDCRGAMAQLVAHLLCKQGVRGSSPLGSTPSQRRFAPAWLLYFRAGTAESTATVTTC
jgi:integrase